MPSFVLISILVIGALSHILRALATGERQPKTHGDETDVRDEAEAVSAQHGPLAMAERPALEDALQQWLVPVLAAVAARIGMIVEGAPRPLRDVPRHVLYPFGG